MMENLKKTYGLGKTILLQSLTFESQLETRSLAEINALVSLIQNYESCTNTSNLKGSCYIIILYLINRKYLCSQFS